MKDEIYFCWVSKTNCIILYGLDQNKDSHNRDKQQILQMHKLSEEYKGLKLNQLSLIFPYKGNEDEEAKV